MDFEKGFADGIRPCESCPAYKLIQDHEEKYHKIDRVRFSPPTLEDIKKAAQEYCKGKDYSQVDCEDFRLYWESCDWKRNGKYIHWKPTLYRWIRQNDRKKRLTIGRESDRLLKQKEKGYNPCL